VGVLMTPGVEDVAGLVTTVLRRQAIRARDLCELRLSVDGNTVTAETTDHVIRIAWRAPMQVNREARIWAAAARAGLPTPSLIGAGDVDGYPYMVCTRLRGWPDPVAPAVLHDAGVKLASLHGVEPGAFPEELDARPRRRNRFALAERFVRAHAGRLGDTVLRCLDCAARDWRTASHTATHGDFRGPNLLAAGNRVTGVVDWSDARRASPEADLGGVDWLRFGAVLDGYRTVRRDLRGAELFGYVVARYAALAEAGVVRRSTAWGVIDRCAAALWSRGMTTDSGD
jgi:aminoglycoside phosphotransferase (APT) family kinase protein